MAGNLENWIVRAYRRFRKRSLRRAIKTADHHVLENLDVARESLRISNDIRNKGVDIIDIVEELRNEIREAIATVEKMRSENRVSFDIVEGIRNKNRYAMDILEQCRDMSHVANQMFEENRNNGIEIKNIVEYTKYKNESIMDIVEETRKQNCDTIDIVGQIRDKNCDVINFLEEIRNVDRRTVDIADTILSEGRDTICIIDEIRNQNSALDNRIRRIELYIIYLMKQAGVAPENLSVEASNSQDPATENDIRFIKLEITKGCVVKNINRIRALTELQCRDVEFLERTLIPEVGLADEDWSFPPEIALMSGKGLHLLQLPCQAAPLLAWLADNARGTEVYLEIGVRWGGMFILISEWLRRFSPEFHRTIALDPAEMSPLIREYDDFISKTDGKDRLEVLYAKEYSTSAAAKDLVLKLKPDFVFIDGDHRYEGVRQDYELVRDQANMLMFHDICASNWPGVGRLWQEAREQNSSTHAAVEFTKQYQTGDGGGMGLGVIKRVGSLLRPQGGDMDSATCRTEDGGPSLVS